ncbi:MAG: ribosome maturation factor RimP [Myxococcota bacterium]
MLEPLIGRHHPLALKVREIIDPVIRRRGLELVDIQFQEGGPSPTLRVYADRAGGISLAALEELSGTLGDLLDVEDPIPVKYALEVSSPGVDRPLAKRSHFQAAMGEEVVIKTDGKVDGSRVHRGILSGVGENELVVQVDGTGRTIPFDVVASAHVVYQFQTPVKPGKKPAPPQHSGAKNPHNRNAPRSHMNGKQTRRDSGGRE